MSWQKELAKGSSRNYKFRCPNCGIKFDPNKLLCQKQLCPECGSVSRRVCGSKNNNYSYHIEMPVVQIRAGRTFVQV